MTYLSLKFLHVVIAIVGVGSSAALLVILGFFCHPAPHAGFMLRLVRRLLVAIVMPGYVLMLATGMWMGHDAALLDARWAEIAMNLWGPGALFIGLTAWSVSRQIRLIEGGSTASRELRRAVWWGRAGSAGWALIVVFILYAMVFKPV